jgi:hypothetical protein
MSHNFTVINSSDQAGQSFLRRNFIPFIGTVGNDRLINHIDGPEVTIHLDLPIRLTGKNYSFIIVKHKDIKQRLKEL